MIIRRRAFSLAELLIVISIIVLMLALAVPAFNFISGSKSQGSANNQVSAILGRARAEAIGLQETRGVFFFYDASVDRFRASLVHAPDFSPWANATNYVVGQYVTANGFYYVCTVEHLSPTTGTFTVDIANWALADAYAIDSILPDADSVTLPTGVGVQLLCDSRIVGGTKTTDGYLKCGAILFDSTGKLQLGRRISICYGGLIGQKMGLNTVNYPDPSSQCITFVVGGIPRYPYESSAGYVLYDREALGAQSFHVEPDNDYWVKDPRYPVANQASEIGTTNSEEKWLDDNGYAVLINRYNGSLIKSE